MNPPLEPAPFGVLFGFFCSCYLLYKDILACLKKEEFSFNKYRYFGGYSKVSRVGNWCLIFNNRW